MMEINRKTVGNITLIVKANRISEKRYLEDGIPKIIDEDYMLRSISQYKQAKKKGTFVHKVYAISENQFNREVQSQNKWVERESLKHRAISKGGLTAILTNQINNGTLR